jgi:hypothetical protein
MHFNVFLLFEVSPKALVSIFPKRYHLRDQFKNFEKKGDQVVKFEKKIMIIDFTLELYKVPKNASINPVKLISSI